MSVTCSTNADLLQWNITLRNDPPNNQRTFERDLSYFGTAKMALPISTALTTLNVSRSLNKSSPLPLISTISTDNTTIDVNGTVITCSPVSGCIGTVITCSESAFLETDSVEIFLVENSIGSSNSKFNS